MLPIRDRFFPVRRSLTDRSRIGCETTIVGKQATGAGRRCTEEPGVKCQLLQVIRDPIGHRNFGKESAAQWVCDFEVLLANTWWELANTVSPCWCRIGPKGSSSSSAISWLRIALFRPLGGLPSKAWLLS